MSPVLPLPPHDTRRRDALSIDALVDSRPLSPRPARQCGKCQEAHSKCDGREPCRNCEDRGTLCGYAWSSFGPPHTLPHPPKSPASIFPQTNGGWALLPQGANAPAASSARSDLAVKSCKTCQARNTPCDGVTPVCGSCRLRRLECYLASPSTDKKGNHNLMTWSARDKQALNPHSFPPSLMTLPPPRLDSAKTGFHKMSDKGHSGKEQSSLHKGLEGPSHRTESSHASSSRVAEASSSRSSLSFMLNPSGGDKSRSDKHATRKLEKPENVHVTPPTPIVASSMEIAQAQAQERMDIDEPRLGSPIQTRATSPGPLRPRAVSPALHSHSPGPLSPSSSTSGAPVLSRRPSRKRSASPGRDWSSPEQSREWASPGRDSVSSLGVSGMQIEGRARSSGSFSRDGYSERRSMDSHGESRRSIDSYQTPQSFDSQHSARHSIDSHSGRLTDPQSNPHSRSTDPHRSHSRTHSTEVSPIDSRPRSRSKSSLSHLLDGAGYGGIGGTSPTDTAPSRPMSAESFSRPMSAESFSRPPNPELYSRPSSSGESSRTPQAESFPRPNPESFPRPESYSRPLTSEPYSRPPNPGSFSRPMTAEYPRPVESPPKPVSADYSRPSTSTSIPKRDSISTTMADMQLKSAGTSRASSPGVFVHSAFTANANANIAFNANPGTSTPRWTTFGAAGESMGRIESNVWRHETEAGMRRREDARQAGQGADLHRRKSEGGVKRRRVGERSISSEGPESERKSSEGERRLPMVEERRMSVVEERRMSIGEPEERKPSADRPMSIVEHVRRVTEAQNAPDPGPPKSQSLPTRRGSAPTPGGWTDETQRDPEQVIVVSDSPEGETADTEMATVDRPEPLIASSEPVPTPSEGQTPVADDSTSPMPHIWHPPTNETTSRKGGKKKFDSEPVPSRSFITRLNLPPVPTLSQTTGAASPDEETRDKEAGSGQPSMLRSMLTMPPRGAFLAAVQSFLAQPASKTHRARAVVMTKSLMKDALGVLLDPQTDELLKGHVPPEKKKEEEKSDKDRDGTPARGRKMSIAIETPDHSSLEFKAWAKRTFSTVKTNRGEDTLAFGGKPVVVEDDIYETIVICHSQGNHCNAEETSRLVDELHSWVPRLLVEAFVQDCPGCPASNKVVNTSAKPKKRKGARGSSAAAARRKSGATRRGKKAQDAEQASRKPRKNSGKEASPEESDGDLENEQEEDELKESGDDVDVKAESKSEDQEHDQDETEADGGEDGDEAEELEMESEDEHVSAAPASRPPVIASLVPDLDASEA